MDPCSDVTDMSLLSLPEISIDSLEMESRVSSGSSSSQTASFGSLSDKTRSLSSETDDSSNSSLNGLPLYLRVRDPPSPHLHRRKKRQPDIETTEKRKSPKRTCLNRRDDLIRQPTAPCLETHKNDDVNSWFKSSNSCAVLAQTCGKNLPVLNGAHYSESSSNGCLGSSSSREAQGNMEPKKKYFSSFPLSWDEDSSSSETFFSCESSCPCDPVGRDRELQNEKNMMEDDSERKAPSLSGGHSNAAKGYKSKKHELNNAVDSFTNSGLASDAGRPTAMSAVPPPTVSAASSSSIQQNGRSGGGVVAKHSVNGSSIFKRTNPSTAQKSRGVKFLDSDDEMPPLTTFQRQSKSKSAASEVSSGGGGGRDAGAKASTSFRDLSLSRSAASSRHKGHEPYSQPPDEFKLPRHVGGASSHHMPEGSKSQGNFVAPSSVSNKKKSFAPNTRNKRMNGHTSRSARDQGAAAASASTSNKPKDSGYDYLQEIIHRLPGIFSTDSDTDDDHSPLQNSPDTHALPCAHSSNFTRNRQHRKKGPRAPSPTPMSPITIDDSEASPPDERHHHLNAFSMHDKDTANPPSESTRQYYLRDSDSSPMSSTLRDFRRNYHPFTPSLPQRRSLRFGSNSERIFRNTPSSNASRPQRGVTRAGAQRGNGSSDRRGWNIRRKEQQDTSAGDDVIVVEADDDESAIARQVEEDERLARILQAQFDAELAEPASPQMNLVDSNDEIEDNDADSSDTSDDDEYIDVMNLFISSATAAATGQQPERPPRRQSARRQAAAVAAAAAFESENASLRRTRPTRRRLLIRQATSTPVTHHTPFHQLNRQIENILSVLFLPTSDFHDTSYEALLALAEQAGDALQRGMPKKDIEQLPTRIYSGCISDDPRESNGHATATAATAGAAAIAPESKECPICLSECLIGDVLRTLPCFHEFHSGCIDKWLERNATCPVCRKEVCLEL